MASVCGPRKPWLTVRLRLLRKGRRDLLKARSVETSSSWEMQASGERSASGCGSVVLRVPSNGSGKPVSLLRRRGSIGLVGVDMLLRIGKGSGSAGAKARLQHEEGKCRPAPTTHTTWPVRTAFCGFPPSGGKGTRGDTPRPRPGCVRKSARLGTTIQALSCRRRYLAFRTQTKNRRCAVPTRFWRLLGRSSK